MTNPTTRRLQSTADALDLTRCQLTITASAGRGQIEGPVTGLDALLDRIQPTRPIVDCDGQLQLFDTTPFTTATGSAPGVADGAPNDPRLRAA